MSSSAGRARVGCLAVAGAVLLVLLGAITVAALLGVWDTESETAQSARAGAGNAAPTESPTAVPGPTPETGCQDATAEFDVFARPSADAQRLAVLDSVELVCWEPTGELRAEAGYPADINAEAQPMVWLCATLSEFLTDSGRDWRGFAAYSTHPATPGEAFLVGSESAGPCTNPQHPA